MAASSCGSKPSSRPGFNSERGSSCLQSNHKSRHHSTAIDCAIPGELVLSRRVIRAWWSSRSSKSSPRHFVSGGRFDSYPLRQPCPSLRATLRHADPEKRPASAHSLRRQGAAVARRHRTAAPDGGRRRSPRAATRCVARKEFPTLRRRARRASAPTLLDLARLAHSAA